MRQQIEAIIDQLIDLLDHLDGDGDLESDPAEYGIGDLDGLLEQLAQPGFTSSVS